MKSINYFLLFLFVIVFCCSCQPASNSLENTKWSGKDSDGDYYEYTFLKDGKIKYKTNTLRGKMVHFNTTNDYWIQSENRVVIVLGDYSVQKGIITNDSINGDAWNKLDKKWTWSVKRVSK